jgi:hypothetical protein
VKFAANRSQLDDSRIPLQQLQIQMCLQLTDQGAQRGLREIDRLRSAREMQVLGDSDERAQMANVDHRFLPLTGSTRMLFGLHMNEHHLFFNSIDVSARCISC